MQVPFLSLQYGKAQRALCRNIERGEVRLLHRDPFGKKAFRFLRRVAAGNAIALQFRGDVQKYGEIVIRRKVGVHGVCPLGNDELFRRGLHGILQLHGSAVEPPVKNLFAAPEREQHLGEKPFPIHIPAGLSKPRGGALLRAEKKSSI